MERRKLPKLGYKRPALILFALWLPVCATSLALSSLYTAGLRPEAGQNIFWLFFASFFVYNIHNEVLVLRYVAQVSGLISGIILCSLSLNVIVIATLASAIWLAYYIWLRSFPVLKPIIISLVWVLTSHSMQIAQLRCDEPAVFRFGIIFVLSLVYDIIDQQTDITQNTETLVLKLGYQKSILLSILTLITFSSLAWELKTIRWAMVISGLCSIALVILVAKKSPITSNTTSWKWIVDSVLLVYAITTFFTT